MWNKNLIYRWILASLVFVLLLFWAAIVKAPDKKDHFYFFDVGQGDSEFVKTGDNFKILIDGGPDNKVLKLLGEKMPFYDKKIDLVIASHNHADHLNGLIEVVKRYDVGEVWISGAVHTSPEYTQWLEALKEKKIKVITKKAGDSWQNNDLKIDFFYPIKNWVGETPTDQHDASLVFKLTTGQTKILYTGDLNESEEQEILVSNADLSADILKVPHHGSATGLNEEFLNKINPRIAVISDGKNNMYHFPAPSILQKLEARNIKIYRTDQNNTIELP